MDINELAEIVIDKPLNEHIANHLPEIIAALQSQQSSVNIDCHSLTPMDVHAQAKDPTYLTDKYLEILPDGIKLLTTTPEIFSMIKDYIPRTIKELSIPRSLFEDISFLSEFPNLETVNFVDWYATVTPEELDYLSENTPIKNITVNKNSSLVDDTLLECPSTIKMIYPVEVWKYKGITIKPSPRYNSIMSTVARIEGNSISDNIEGIRELYTSLGDKISGVKSIKIIEKSPQVNESNGRPLEINMNISETGIDSLSITSNQPQMVSKVAAKITELSPVQTVRMVCDNKTYDDFYYLSPLSKKVPLEIEYGNYATSYDGFLNMRYAIDYYKELIESYELSPVEKIAFAYDIMKTFEYQEDTENKDNARRIPEIVTYGNIVCRGYTVFINQILSELGIKTTPLSVTTTDEKGEEGRHLRTMITVDDDKYDIHGVYVLDPTWDSSMKNLSLATDKDGNKRVTVVPENYAEVNETYDALSLYRYFLVPITEYPQCFPKDSTPNLYEALQTGSLQEHIAYMNNSTKEKPENYIVGLPYEIENLFGENVSSETVESYATAPKPSLETFEEIIKNVRLAEGYTETEATTDIDRVVELHRMINEQTHSSPNSFFQSSQTK